MCAMAPQITSASIVCSIVGSGGDQRKLQSSASLAFVRGIQRCPVNSPHKGPVTWKMFQVDDVIMSAWNIHTQLTNDINVIENYRRINDKKSNQHISNFHIFPLIFDVNLVRSQSLWLHKGVVMHLAHRTMHIFSAMVVDRSIRNFILKIHLLMHSNQLNLSW